MDEYMPTYPIRKDEQVRVINLEKLDGEIIEDLWR